MDSSCWIGRIQEIRGPSDSDGYVLIFWMYHPDELPNGRSPHHAANELVASNYLQVIMPHTILRHATVVYSDEKSWLEGPPRRGTFFYRQALDFPHNQRITVCCPWPLHPRMVC